MLAVSTMIGPYEILSPLGSGGMGDVYRARDTRLDRDVAVKVLSDTFADDREWRGRFEQEAKAVAALSHPNILAIHDFGTHGDTAYAVMELLEGVTLRDRLNRGPIPWQEAVEILAAVCDGLAEAHARRIVHRDLKPENLFLTSTGRVKILDFGLSRMDRVVTTDATQLYEPARTSPGTVLGTVGYMSPEQARGQQADARSDLFSLGCVLFEMLTGRRAFRRNTPAETLTAILHDEPTGRLDADKQIPGYLARLIRQCLAKRPSDRLQSASDLASALRAAAASHADSRKVQPSGFAVAVALLPLQCAGGQSTGENAHSAFLGQGLTEQLIQGLSQVGRENLKVRPFHAVSRYQHQRIDPVAIGRELRVTFLVTGTLHQLDGDLWASIAVVDAREDNQLWGKRYQTKLVEVLELRDQITRDLAPHLGLDLDDQEFSQLLRRATDEPEAFLNYCQARYHGQQFTEVGLTKSLECCRRALQKDPRYALAYNQLGFCHVALGVFHRDPRSEFPEARKFFNRALANDSGLMEAKVGLAAVGLFYDRNWSAAEQTLAKTEVSDPAQSLFAFCLAANGRPTEALTVIRQVRDHHPESARRSYEFARCLNWTKACAQAAEAAEQALELDPEFYPAYEELGHACLRQKMSADGIAALQKAVEISGRHPRPLGLLGQAFAVAGQFAQAREISLELINSAPRRSGQPLALARIFAALDEPDAAFEWLQLACDERDSGVIFIQVDPTLDVLRGDPRFDALLEHLGLTSHGSLTPPAAVVEQQAVQAVAVLPLENIGRDPRTEFLCDGVADQIINSLCQVRHEQLKVRPFSSVSRYKTKKADVDTVARELGVQVVVTGTLARDGDELSIRVALIDVQQDNHFWGKRYQTHLDRILDVQDQIARDVAASLRLRLTGDEERLLTKRYTDDDAAYLLYSEANYHHNKFTESGLLTAIDYCRRAFARDPNYALAHFAMGRSYHVLGSVHNGWRGTYEEAKRHHEAALLLDDTLAEAHSGLAVLHLMHDWDWGAAKERLERAIALNPVNPIFWEVQCFCQASLGQLSEAYDSVRRALELNPLSARTSNVAAMCLNWMRHHENAIAESRRILELDPGFPLAYYELGLGLIELGHVDVAISELQQGLSRGHTHPRVQGLFGYAHAVASDRPAAERVLEELLKQQDRFGLKLPIARIFTALGEIDKALDWLQRACDERDSAVIWIKVDPTLDRLRGDPRFAKILESMGLPR